MGYSEKSKGYRFYCPDSGRRIMETNNAKFIEERTNCVSVDSMPKFEEETANPMFLDQQVTVIPATEIPLIPAHSDYIKGRQEEEITLSIITEDTTEMTTNENTLEPSITPVDIQPEMKNIRKPQRNQQATLLPDFMYLNEVEHHIRDEDDSISFNRAISSARSKLWHMAMGEELQSMKKNNVWTLVPNNK